MAKWKVSLLMGLAGMTFGWWPGCDLSNISLGGFGDLIQDVIFGVLFD